MTTRPALLAIVAAALLGACTRSLPSSFPTTSAASRSAEHAPAGLVGRSLREDPPLPGEPTAGWEALEGSPTTRSSGSAEPLGLDRAIALALGQNRELRASLRELGVERGLLLQASLLPNPELEVELREQSDADQPVQVELTAAFELTEALLTPLRAQAAGRDLEAARLGVAARVIETEYEVRAAFYAAQAAEQRLALALRSLDALAASRDTAVMLFESGNVPELVVATHVVAYEEARATVAELELERASSRERLTRLLGLHGEATRWRIEAPLASVPASTPVPEDLETVAIASSLELAQMRAALEALAQRVGLSRAEGWIPDVTIDVHAEQDGQTWEAGGGLSVSLPVFDRNDGLTAAYEARFDALLERYEGAAIDTRSFARATTNQLVSAELRARQYESVIVPARARVLEQSILQYDAMQIDVFALVSALRARLAAELESVEALRRYWTVRAALDALVRGRRVGVESGAESIEVRDDAASAGGH